MDKAQTKAQGDELVCTSDGSMSLRSARFGETYHSHHGAITESMLVFIENGLKALPGNLSEYFVFEMGFGTGFNALLSFLHKAELRIVYETVEKYPLDSAMWESFAKSQWPEKTPEGLLFEEIHRAPWDEIIQLREGFSIYKRQADLLEMPLPSSFYHLVFFDAFSLDAQPELWTEKVFSRLFASMQQGGILVTYSSRGEVKRNLRAAGFTLERLAGPPGKRHVLRATKP